ncbi:16S rRNA (uracil(1498)-N(3))-methyltransferase [Schinkia azotoformans]|uniref:16S rRNA (uracil(1498)-N(3))-methyltransferase n=1 Tax=Schinkia azotoformans TaxID=1454 RepID=UPI002DB60402|nr:16S rRNA (uracil(1498)-N(3))-methyltransferase [Schinkia azotoformans]MEC1720179.1 16S rRNA (uracil(1498)-N(3))-methyltransferase [Schinkia azotoformans]MED4413182.1 16S rRNA (uracil(1498)-N(3))-methyltransferase [Schinkia azotoformans]
MQRYFVKNDQITENKIEISGEDAHHISRVMRMKPGENIICCSEDGQVARCEIQEITDDLCFASIVEWIDENKELPVFVTIAQGLPKGDKLELVVQKGTEMGAHCFLPFFASRSIVKWDEKKGRKKVERLEKIAKEAAEQSHRTKVPEINEPVNFKTLLNESKNYTYKIVAYEEDAKLGEKSNLFSVLSKLASGDSLLAVIGPEGGLTEEEVSELRNNGFISCSLGQRILRTETAPLYLLAAVSYHTELLG